MTTIEKVRELVIQQGGISDITNTTTFEEMGMDSLDITELVIELEEEFDVNFPDEEIEQFIKGNIQQLAELVDAKS